MLSTFKFILIVFPFLFVKIYLFIFLLVKNQDFLLPIVCLCSKSKLIRRSFNIQQLFQFFHSSFFQSKIVVNMHVCDFNLRAGEWTFFLLLIGKRCIITRKWVYFLLVLSSCRKGCFSFLNLVRLIRDWPSTVRLIRLQSALIVNHPICKIITHKR